MSSASSALEDFASFDLGELDLTTEFIAEGDLREAIEALRRDDYLRALITSGDDWSLVETNMRRNLDDLKSESVEDYVRVSEDIAHIHAQIRECDQVLEGMEQLLGGFQDDLRNIGSEIRQLQEASYSMNIKLNNRKKVFDKLSSFSEAVVVPPDLFENICEMPVGDQYLLPLLDLDSKLTMVREVSEGSNVDGIRQCYALSEMQPFLEKLSSRAVEKCRDFLLSQLDEMRKSKSNTQMLQQTLLLRFRFFYEFLTKYNSECAQEIEMAYIETVARAFQASLKSYWQGIYKLKVDVAGKSDVLGARDSSSRSGTAVRVYSLGSRINVLYDTEDFQELVAPSSSSQSDSDGQEGVSLSSHTASSSEPSRSSLDRVAPPSVDMIVPFLASKEKQKYYFEQIFRSFHMMLTDLVTGENVFEQDFFGSAGLLPLVFERTTSYILEQCEGYVNGSYDAVGMQLLVRLVHHFQQLSTRRSIAFLDTYYDHLKRILFSRMSIIMESHMESLSKAPTSITNAHQQFVVRRYAELSSSLYKLNMPRVCDLTDLLHILRARLEEYLARVCAESFTRETAIVDRVVFLINNYDLICSIYEDRGVIELDDYISFSEMLKTQIRAFVDYTFQQYFADFVLLIRSNEPRIKARNDEDQDDEIRSRNRSEIDEDRLERSVIRFAETWKKSISQLYENVMQYFSNFRTGLHILKQVLTQMLMYNSRLHKIVDSCYANPPFRTALVSNNVILFEFKAFSKDL